MREKAEGSIYELFMLGLCVYVLIALAITTFVRLDDATLTILDNADTAICFIFIADFVYKLTTAKNKLGYLKWGWIDLLSSIPMIDFLRWGRFARIIRIFRLLRALRSTRRIVAFVLRKRGEATFLALSLSAIILMVVASIAILQVEKSDGSNIKDASDALWWSFVTVTTVGYGDRYPVTPEGRFIAGILMIVGVGLFGTFTGLVASWFIEPEEKQQELSLSDLSHRMERIELLLEQIAAAK